MSVTAIVNAQLVLESGILFDGAMVIEDGRIAAFGKERELSIPQGAKIVDAQGAYVGPGFVDIHVHGCDHHSTCLNPESAGKYFLRHGTTSFLATPDYSQNFETIMQALSAIQAARGKVPNLKGIYMEGPYMNPERGSHAWLNPWRDTPKPEQYQPMVDAGGDYVKIWAIAPEREGLKPFLEYARKVNPDVMFAIGHSDASPDQIRSLGAKFRPAVHTHLYDATGRVEVPGGTPPYGPNEYCLNNPEVYAELICDSCGVHVHSEVQQSILACKGIHRVILITDGTCCDGDAPEHLKHVTDLNFDPHGGIAGSRLTMDKACRNIMEHTNCGIAQAFIMASTNAARLLGMDDDIGSIALGKIADLVFVDDRFHVQQVMLAGEVCNFEEK